MNDPASNSPVLRFVDAGRCDEATALPERNEPQDLAWSDARWILATRVAESLEGYSAAIITPEKRDHLLRLSTMLGLRPFDANLIIAIVQDSVRCGLDPLSRSTVERLQMVAGARTHGSRRAGLSPLMMAAWAAMFGMMGALALINFVGG